MPTDFENRLAGSLDSRARTGSPVDPSALLRTAVDRGRRRRTRRVATTVVAAALAVTGATVAGVVATRASTPEIPIAPAPAPSASAPDPARGKLEMQAPEKNFAVLPAAGGVPGAAIDPGQVATDPALVHFSIAALAARASAVSYRSDAMSEAADVQTYDSAIHVAIARERSALPASDSWQQRGGGVLLGPAADVSVAGRPATAAVARERDSTFWSVRWQPADGLWALAEVRVPALDEALQMVTGIRFDRSTQLLLPYRLTGLPPGTDETARTLSLQGRAGHVFSSGTLVFSDGRRHLEFRGAENWVGGADYPRDLKAGKYRVKADPDKHSFTLLAGPLYVEVIKWWSPETYTKQQVLDTIATFEVAADIDDPATWW